MGPHPIKELTQNTDHHSSSVYSVFIIILSINNATFSLKYSTEHRIINTQVKKINLPPDRPLDKE